MEKYARGSSTSEYYANLPPGLMMQLFPLIPQEMDRFEASQSHLPPRRGEKVVGREPYESGLVPGDPNYAGRGKMVVGTRK